MEGAEMKIICTSCAHYCTTCGNCGVFHIGVTGMNVAPCRHYKPNDKPELNESKTPGNRTDGKRGEQMTDETKELFDAPYKVVETRNGYNVICTNKLIPQLCWTTGEKDAARIARLPELYDTLMVAARVYCPYASFDCHSEEECPHIQIRTGIAKRCVALGWLALLKKVRDGE